MAEFRADPFHIRSGSDRYFFADDREAGGRLMGELAAYAESGTGPTQAMDCIHYRPQPRPGTLEIWLPTA